MVKTLENNSVTTTTNNAERTPSRLPGTNYVLGSNSSIRRIARHAERASEVGCTVLISGETGTGKEVWAEQLHSSGPRADKAFVPVNCAALTTTLAESQLFGHEKGAFTGAAGASLGVFRAAHSGVVFLDEVGEMPMELQPKLLRVLQQQEVTPVGASKPIPVDIQVIAATNRNLEEEVMAGNFREDLYFRLNMVELKVPSLRERVDDIPEFIDYFSQKYSQKYNQTTWIPDPEVLSRFCEYHWPGNIRQLSQVIEQSYVLDCEPTLPNSTSTNRPANILPFFDLNRLRDTALKQALNATNGHKGRAAKLLGIHANTLTRMLAQIESETAD